MKSDTPFHASPRPPIPFSRNSYFNGLFLNLSGGYLYMNLNKNNLQVAVKMPLDNTY